MKKTILLLVTLFSLGSLQATTYSAGYTNENESDTVNIRVLIRENIEGALVDVKGGYRVRNPENNKRLSSALFGKRYFLQTSHKGIKWGESFYGIHQIKINPKKHDTSILIDGIQYRGAVAIYDVNSKLFLVNEIDVEDYLKSMLSSKFSFKNLSNAALDSLAITARTNLYYEVSRHNNPFWDIRASEDDYRGYSMAYINPEIDRAVNATKNLILIHNKKPFATSWTENCAGQTASFHSIFRKDSSGPEGVAAPFAKKNRESHHWKCAFSKEELAHKFDLKSISSIELFQDPTSKKTYGLRIHDGTRFVEKSFSEFQECIGATRVLSNDLAVHLVKETVIFEGYGEGLGVGLCLFSADAMAKIGDGAPQILSAFYPDSRLVKMGTIVVEKHEEENKEGE